MTRDSKRTRQPNMASSIYEGTDGYWHGRVTVGIKDDGKPDRRHVSRKTKAAVTQAVRKLERERDNGTLRKAGERWRVKDWLTHWLEHIAKPSVGENTYSGYRVDVNVHLIPGVGAHWLDKLKPEHLEGFYGKMRDKGSKPATVHHAHRTIRAALNEALRRGVITRNPALLAKAPKVVEEEVEPYSIDQVRGLLRLVAERRNGARWALALALGLRQGETLGLKWRDLDLDARTLRVRRHLLRPKYKHGCANPCGRKPGFCPDRVRANPLTKDTKSAAGRRPVGLPAPVADLLQEHRRLQEKEREQAGHLWERGDWVFTDVFGHPVSPNTDFREWKALLKEAGLREARLHDARHTAATVLLILEVPDRAVMGLMGWSSGSMLKRYQHLVDQVRSDVADRVGGLIWERPERADNGAEEAN
ncbi:tyrosine-type recombinase/integrase [Nocardiopsis suaedae]|uniref:Site-specific integrase n=1 Tax=Nocardiopsis suaedae TaxID=3018444 RepID=A0ABT4TN61_9ACTN|nr:site-specific integrase [Nocardiopsis suaedae]MDA2806132.1 site-specific integrase [Nocardiopsis suaedae]